MSESELALQKQPLKNHFCQQTFSEHSQSTWPEATDGDFSKCRDVVTNSKSIQLSEQSCLALPPSFTSDPLTLSIMEAHQEMCTGMNFLIKTNMTIKPQKFIIGLPEQKKIYSEMLCKQQFFRKILYTMLSTKCSELNLCEGSQSRVGDLRRHSAVELYSLVASWPEQLRDTIWYRCDTFSH